MKRLANASKWVRLALIGSVLAIGTLVLAPATETAADPPLLCGPSLQWSCVVPGCPTCPDVLFLGTVCEKEEFEKETGRVCSPL